MRLTLQNLGFGLAGAIALFFTLTIPLDTARGVAYVFGEFLGALVLVAGFPLLLRAAYVKWMRPRARLPLRSGWLLVMASVFSLLAHTAQ